jgi:protein O-mannosyl-transferase
MRRSAKKHDRITPAAAQSHDALARQILAVASVVAVACALAYGNTFCVPFIFDDTRSIAENPTIKRLWPPWGMLLPPCNGEAVQRRPVANVSLAINYAISGEKVWSYHALNLAAHISAALLLFGVVRRTLAGPGPTCRRQLCENDAASLAAAGAAATPLAAAVALLWAVHPLLTEAVTYVVQRTEVLAGMFYLLTLYCVIRGSSSPRAILWYAAAVLSCAMAVGSKESAISAPVVVLLYDRVFLCPSWREIFRRRWALYAGLAASWFIVLAMLPYGHEGTAIFGRRGQGFDYLLSQGGVIVHYLRLCFWPYPLVLDYGFLRPQPIGQQLPYVILIVVLLLAVSISFRRRPWLGFLGVWFFAILAPSSSIIPLPQQVAAEKRMYLPLAAVVTAVVLGGNVAGRWLIRRRMLSPLASRRIGATLTLFVAAVLGILTYQRNADYLSEMSIWRDVISKAPGNARGYGSLARILASRGRSDEAIEQYRKALEIMPDYTDALNNLGLALAARGQIDAAMAQYRKALEIDPDFADTHYNLGILLDGLGRTDEAIAEYQKTLEINPDFAEAHNNLGNALIARGQPDAAYAQFMTALKLNPDLAETHNNLGNILADRGEVDKAILHYEKALEIKPDYAIAHNSLGNALAGQGRIEAAVAHFQRALEIQPDYAKARANLDRILPPHPPRQKADKN